MILESFANGLVQALIGFTMSVAIVFAIEQLPLGLTAAHRSWMWRAVYLKTLFWLVFPATWIAPLEMRVRPWMPEIVPASCVPRFESPVQPIVRTAPNRGTSMVPPNANGPSAAVLPRVSRNEVSLSEAGDVSPLGMDAMTLGNESELGLQAEPKLTLLHSQLWIGIALWCMGAAGMVVLLSHRAWQTVRILRRSTRRVPPHLLTMANQTASRLGIRKPSRVELSNEISVPMLVLSGNAQLILPADFEARFGLEGCRMAIAHELAHHKRRDLWWNLLPTMVSIVLFFWPPAWLAARRYYLAMELACDESAIRSAKLGHAAYAGLLVRLLEDQGRRRMPAHALSMAWSGTFRALSERIRFMKIDLQNQRYRRPISALVMVATIGLLMLPWAGAQGQDNNSKRSGASKKSNRNSASSTNRSGTNSSYGAIETPPTPEQPPANVASGFSSGSAFGFGNSAGGGNGVANGFGTGGNGSSMAFGNGGGTAMSGGGGSVSGGVAIGLPGNPPADLESPGAQSSRGGRSTGSTGLSFGGGNVTDMFSDQKPLVTRSRDLRNGSMRSRTQVRDGNMEVLIEEISDKGYVITIREQLKSRSKMRRVQAKNIEELEEKYPVAYEWVRKYHLAGVTLDEESEDGETSPGPQIGMKRRETTTRSSHSFSAAGGGASGGASAGGSNGFGGFSTDGGAAGNQAFEMMETQILQQIQQADNPILKEHLHNMLQQIRQSKNQGNGNRP